MVLQENNTNSVTRKQTDDRFHKDLCAENVATYTPIERNGFGRIT